MGQNLRLVPCVLPVHHSAVSAAAAAALHDDVRLVEAAVGLEVGGVVGDGGGDHGVARDGGDVIDDVAMVAVEDGAVGL